MARKKSRWERVGAKKEGHAPEPWESDREPRLFPIDLPLTVFWRSFKELSEAGWRPTGHPVDGEGDLLIHLVPEPNRFTLLLEGLEEAEGFPDVSPLVEGRRLARVVAGGIL